MDDLIIIANADVGGLKQNKGKPEGGTIELC